MSKLVQVDLTSTNHMYVVGFDSFLELRLVSTLLSRCIEHLGHAEGDESDEPLS